MNLRLVAAWLLLSAAAQWLTYAFWVGSAVSTNVTLPLSLLVATGGVIFAIIAMIHAAARTRGFHEAARLGLLLLYAFVAIDFVVFGFANVYFATSQRAQASFSEGPISKATSVYMAVGTLTTSGLGSVTADTDHARLIVMSQMIVDFLVIATTVALVASAMAAKDPVDFDRP